MVTMKVLWWLPETIESYLLEMAQLKYLQVGSQSGLMMMSLFCLRTGLTSNRLAHLLIDNHLVDLLQNQ